LFEGNRPYRYHVIASNHADAAATMEWYCKRGGAGENRIKDLKIGFCMEHMPSGAFEANAALFAIGITTYMGFRRVALGKEWEPAQVQSMRCGLFQTAGAMAA
jgi:hypothetical protein